MRCGRIIPPLVLLLSVLSLLSLSAIADFQFPPSVSLKESLISALTFRYNSFFLHGGSTLLGWAVLWSLSIEEVFYLAYPLIARVTGSTAWLVAILIEIIAFAPLYRLRDPQTTYDYFGCFDGIAFGAVAAFAARRFSNKVPLSLVWVVMIVGIAIVGYTYATFRFAGYYNQGITLTAAGSACVLFASQCLPFSETRPLRYDPLTYLGRLSYEVYLLHMTIFALLSHVVLPGLAPYPKLIFFVVILCVVAVSGTIHRFYSEPLNQWLRSRLLAWRKGRPAEMVAIAEPAVGLRRATGQALTAGVSILLLLAPAVYAVRNIPQAHRFALRVLFASRVWQTENPAIVITNPQGNDSNGVESWYWIGPDATIELDAEFVRIDQVRRFSLSFDAKAGQLQPDRACGLILRGPEGDEQKFDFVDSGVARFNVAVHQGKNIYTLKVVYPTEVTLIVPGDARKFFVKIENPALTELPAATGNPSSPATR